MTRAAAVALLLLAAGCGLVISYQRAPTPGADAGDWGRLREQASRQASLYDGFDHRASAAATWLSPLVKEAAVRRQAEWQGKNAAEVEQAVARARAEAARGEEFMVAVYTAERRANDLDAPRSIWHLELDDGETRVPAAEVTAVPADANVRQLFPYVGPFDLVYAVRFPWTGAPLQGRPFMLRISSSLGSLPLDFGPTGHPAVTPRATP